MNIKRRIKKLLKNTLILSRENTLENNISELISFTWDKRIECNSTTNMCKRIFNIMCMEYIDVYDLLNSSLDSEEKLQGVYEHIREIAEERKITLKG